MNNQEQIVNLPYFQRDLYLLIALFLSDEKVARNENYREISEIVVESEVNHLLIGIAISSRQLLDTKKLSINDKICGKFWESYHDDRKKDPSRFLNFRKACNIIIHAIEILPYDDPDLGYFTGNIIIRGRKRSNTNKVNRAILDFHKFSEHCIELIREFS